MLISCHNIWLICKHLFFSNNRRTYIICLVYRFPTTSSFNIISLEIESKYSYEIEAYGFVECPSMLL